MTGPAPTVPGPLAAPPAAAERVSAWRGRFADPALEEEFRRTTWDECAQRLRVVAILASCLVLGFGYIDYRELGWGVPLAVMWCGRALLLGLAFGVAWWLRRPRSVAALDRSALLLMLAIAGLVLLVVFVQRKGIARETPSTLLAVIGFYFFLSTRFVDRVACGMLLSAAFLAAQAAWGPPAWVEWTSAATQFLILNALGAFTAARNQVALRREFLGLRLEQRHRRELQDSVAALEKSNAELEQFAYVASHDLQSPLRSVISFAQLLQRRHGDALRGKGGEYVDTIIDSATRMQGLLTDLLAFARVGREPPAPVVVDAETVLADVTEGLAARIQETGARLTHDRLPLVAGRPGELRQLLQNLVDNAIKFQRSGAPQVHVSAHHTGTAWEFSVRDNGIGIRPEHRDRIFKLFGRLHDAETYPGTGIGLAICQKIVQQHGGRIWVESEPGRGSTFRFTVPG